MCTVYAVMPVELNGKIKWIGSIKDSYSTTASQAIIVSHKVSLHWSLKEKYKKENLNCFCALALHILNQVLLKIITLQGFILIYIHNYHKDSFKVSCYFETNLFKCVKYFKSPFLHSAETSMTTKPNFAETMWGKVWVWWSCEVALTFLHVDLNWDFPKSPKELVYV